MPGFGIVVIGRNEGERLLACLRVLAGSGAPVVYSDSQSADGSPEAAERMGAIVVRLDPSRPMNAARGRKEGTEALALRHPSLDYVLYLDGDCILQPSFAAEAVAFLDAHPQAAAVCGRRFEAHPEASFYNRLCDEEWNTPIGRADACGGDSMMRLAAVNAVGGFDESLMASEEPELSARLRAAGWEIWRIDVPMTKHDAAIFTFGAFWRRHLRGGIGYYQAWQKSRSLPAPINGPTLRSAAVWTAALPLVAVALAVTTSRPAALLLIPLAYLLQIGRIAARLGISDPFSWKKATALMLIKPAEFLGAASAALGRRGRDSIRYKAA